MGTVYLGEHPVIGQRVAIKVLLPKLSTDREAVGRFFNEARAAALVHHPGIIQIFDAGHHAVTGSAYLVMEHVDGETLARRIERVGPPVASASRSSTSASPS